MFPIIEGRQGLSDVTMFSQLNDTAKKYTNLEHTIHSSCHWRTHEESHKIFQKSTSVPENFVFFLTKSVGLIIHGKLLFLQRFCHSRQIGYLDNDTTFNQIINNSLPHHKQFRQEYVYLHKACIWPPDKITRIHVVLKCLANHRISPWVHSEAAIRWTVTFDKWQRVCFLWRKKDLMCITNT